MKIELTKHHSDSFGSEFDQFIEWLEGQGHRVSITTESCHHVESADPVADGVDWALLPFDDKLIDGEAIISSLWGQYCCS